MTQVAIDNISPESMKKAVPCDEGTNLIDNTSTDPVQQPQVSRAISITFVDGMCDAPAPAPPPLPYGNGLAVAQAHVGVGVDAAMAT